VRDELNVDKEADVEEIHQNILKLKA